MEETKNQLIQTGFTLDRLHQDGKIDDEAYTILKDRNKQAINYSQCCKSDSEQLFIFYKELKKAGRLYNDNLSDDIMKREAEWFVKKK